MPLIEFSVQDSKSALLDRIARRIDALLQKSGILHRHLIKGATINGVAILSELQGRPALHEANGIIPGYTKHFTGANAYNHAYTTKDARRAGRGENGGFDPW